MPESLEQLDLLLLTVARTRKIRRYGISFQGNRYLDLTLAAYVGERVTIRYDPRDVAEIRVFHHDRFLCRAICSDLARQTISLKELQAARNKRRRELRAGIRQRLDALETLRCQPDSSPAPDQPTRSDSDAPPRTRLRIYEAQ